MLAFACSVAACRQPDGPMPTPGQGSSNDLGDLSKDLLNVTGRVKDSPQELTDDLVRFAQEKKVEPPAGELGRRVVDTVAGSKLTEPDAAKLARTLWVIIRATELSDRQVKSMEGEV